MNSAYTLFGELTVKTDQFKKELQDSEKRLEGVERAITNVEQKSKALGQTSATSARQYQKLNEKLNEQKQELLAAADAYDKGEINAKQMTAAIQRFDTAMKGAAGGVAGLNVKLTDLEARQRGVVSGFRQLDSSLKAVGNGLRTAGQGITSIGTSLSIGLTAPLTAAGYALFQAGVNASSLKNQLYAATGSMDAASNKLKELRDLSKESAGVLSNQAVALYGFLKPMGMADGTINSMIKALGRLKLANDQLDIQQFSRNLTQLWTQGFERTDMKEAVGAFPRFGEIMKEAFKLSGSDLETISKEMKGLQKAGKVGADDFMLAFANAVETDKNLASLQDTITTKMEKMFARVRIAFEPFGEALANILMNIGHQIEPVITQLGQYFSSLSPAVQSVVFAIAGIALALGPSLMLVGKFVAIIGSIGVSAKAIGFIGLALAGIALQLAPVIAVAAAWYAAWQTNFGGIRDLINDISSFIVNKWNGAITEISQYTDSEVQKITQFWNDHKAEFQATMKEIEQYVAKGVAAMRRFWADHGDDITQSVSAAWKAIKIVVSAGVDGILAVIRVIAAAIRGDWIVVWDGLKTAASSGMKGAIAVLIGSQSAVLAALKTAFMGLFYIGAWIHTQALQLGVNLVKGLVNGILSMHSAVIDAGKRLGQWAIDSTKNALAIKSPSRVFMAIGKDTAQGFIDGIAAMKASTQAAMADILDVSKLKLGKKDADGVQYLTSMVMEMAKFGDLTRGQLTALELTSGKYKDINASLKEAIVNAADKLDKMTATADIQKRMLDLHEKMNPLTAFQSAQALITQKAYAGIEESLKRIYPLYAKFADISMNPLQSDGGASATRNPGEGKGTGMMALMFPEPSELELIRQQIDAIFTKVAIPPPLEPWEQFWGFFKYNLDRITESLPSFKEALGVNLIDSISNIGSVFTNAVNQWDGTAKGFFKSIASGFAQMAQQIIQELIRIAIIKAITAAIGGGFGGGSSSFSSGISGMSGASWGGGFARGGYVSGEGSSTSDSIFARLSNGEFVMNAKAVKRYGTGFFEQLNKPFLPQFRDGGLVGGSSSSTITNSTINQAPATINFNFPNVKDAGSFQQSKGQIMREMSQAMQATSMRGIA